MSAKIRISYEYDHELALIMQQLKPLIYKSKLGNKQENSPYKHVYIEVKNIVKNAKTRME